MRARVLVLAIAGCSPHAAGGDDMPGPCDRAGHQLTVGAITVTAQAGGIVHLRYGEDDKASWAIVDAPAPDASARVGDTALCTAEMTVAIRDGRVRATLADGTIVVDDAEPFTPGTLVRHAQADRVYGLGERTGGLDKRGRAWTFWNTDAYDPSVGGWHPDQDPLYQSIPLEVHLAASAFGIFTDVPDRMVIELGGPIDRVATTGTIDQYLIAGPRIADVVDRYTRLTGRPAVPPRWALGFQQSRWGYASQAEIEDVAARFRELDIPADALWLDIQHMHGFRSFTFDPQAFPDPRGMIERLAARGFRVVAIEDPGIKIDPGWDVYDSGAPHFLRRGTSIYEGVGWAGGSAWPDFTSADARAWWGGLVARTRDLGVAGIWLDVNEPTTFPEGGGGNTVPDDVLPSALHNVYALLEARATYEALGAQPFVLSRAGYAGIQRYAATWTGDTPSTWTGLAQTLPMLLGLGLSGEPFCGSDIGGYSGHATPELYARWIALGSISPFSRAHVTSGVPGQEPWQFGIEVTDAARDVLKQRYHVLPYLAALAAEAGRSGAPVLRPLVFDFQDDPNVLDVADEAMLGPFVLAAPVVEAGVTSRRVYLPAGRWYDLASDEAFEGPTTIDVAAPLAALPVFARAGAIVPTDDGVDLYPGAASQLVLDDGTTIAFDGTTVTTSRALVVRIHRIDHGVTSASVPYAYDANARVVTATVDGSATFVYDAGLDAPRPTIDVTFEVHVPAGTPTDSPICVASSATGWTHVPLAWVAPGIARGMIAATRGDWIDYKITRGSWATVEKQADCSERPNRTRVAAAATRTVTVGAWRDGCGG